MGDIINAAADVFGFGPASKQAKATTQAANISAQSTREALALQQRMYEEGIGRQKPFLEIGTNALNRLNALNQPGANAAQFLQMDPGYAFRLSEGMKGVERSAAARGGLMSGATGKALTRYGQDFGSQEFNNAYNRLANLANLGPRSAGVMSELGTGYANQANQLGMVNAANQGNLALQRGNISASQYGNYGSALNTALNTDWNALGKRFGYGGGSGGFQDVGGEGAASNAALAAYGI
jgi:hypothetical protein